MEPGVDPRQVGSWMCASVCILHTKTYQSLARDHKLSLWQVLMAERKGWWEKGSNLVTSENQRMKLAMITFIGEPGCCGIKDPAGFWDCLACGYVIIYRFSPLCSPGATSLSFASACWVGSTPFLEAWFSTKHLAHFPQSLPLQGKVMTDQISKEIKILPSSTEWSPHRPETESDRGSDKYCW